MATENYYPITSAPHDLPVGFDGGALISRVGGSNLNDVMIPGGGRAGPATHDDATTYLQNWSNGAGYQYSAHNVSWPGPMASYIGTSFTLGMDTRALLINGIGSNATRNLGFVNAAGTQATIRQSRTGGLATTGWFIDGPSDVSNAATYRPGAGSWTASDFANDTTIFMVVGAHDDSGGGQNTANNITSIWGEIDYNPPSGGFAFMLGLAGLMSLQLAGPMTDYTQFEKFLQWRHDYHPRHTILTADEKVQSWDEYKSYRAPRFFYG